MLNIEHKRMHYIKGLSLAQKMGLASRPELPLGLVEWKVIEKTYLDRTNKEREN